MKWVKVLRQDELPEGARRVVNVGGRPILLLRDGRQIRAMDNTCPHMGAALETGEVTEEGTIVCPRHHSAFDLKTGEVKAWAPWPPGVGRVLARFSTEKPLPLFPTRVQEGSIWVEVEE